MALAATARRAEFVTAGGDYIARVKITGLIRNDQERVESLERLAKSTAKAVIVHIDSPGGTTAGSEQLHNSLRQVAAAKPLVVVVDGLAASGGYIAAMSADHIVAQGTSLVGSIGVILQYPNVADLLKTIGVKVEEVKSSPLKAAPNGYEPTSPEARAALEALVKDSYDWFRGMVRDRRKLDEATLAARRRRPRVHRPPGRSSSSSSTSSATRRPRSTGSPRRRGSKADTPVRDWQLKSRFGDLTMLHLAGAVVLEAVGLGSLARRIEDVGHDPGGRAAQS